MLCISDRVNIEIWSDECIGVKFTITKHQNFFYNILIYIFIDNTHRAQSAGAV